MRGGNSIRCEEKQTKPEIANYSQVDAGVPILAPGAGAHYIMDLRNNGKNASWYSAREPLSFLFRVSSRTKQAVLDKRSGNLTLANVIIPTLGNKNDLLWFYNTKEYGYVELGGFGACSCRIKVQQLQHTCSSASTATVLCFFF